MKKNEIEKDQPENTGREKRTKRKKLRENPKNGRKAGSKKLKKSPSTRTNSP
ncbi:MAG: hypothetical protein AB9907_01235 [Flexilinea sp.]